MFLIDYNNILFKFDNIKFKEQKILNNNNFNICYFLFINKNKYFIFFDFEKKNELIFIK